MLYSFQPGSLGVYLHVVPPTGPAPTSTASPGQGRGFAPDAQGARAARGPSRALAGVMALLMGVLAFWFVQQWRLQNLIQQTAAAREAASLTQLVQASLAQDAALQARLATVRQDAAAAPSPPLQQLHQRVRAAQVHAGLAAASGPGVTVVLRDAARPAFPGEPAQLELVHDQYVLHIVGLLAAAGARAISIAGQRYVGTTAIYCAGPTISVNGVTTGSPFVIRAVGQPTALLAALAGDPDVQGWSQLVSIQFRPAPLVVVPALSAAPVLSWLVPGGRLPTRTGPPAR